MSGKVGMKWGDRGKLIDDGYVKVYIGNGKYRAEHRLVMEKLLGRKLKSDEIAHHIDESFEARSNNDPSNLQLISRPDHISHHSKGKGKGYTVCQIKYNNKWQLIIRDKIKKKWRYVGLYITKEKAIDAVNILIEKGSV